MTRPASDFNSTQYGRGDPHLRIISELADNLLLMPKLRYSMSAVSLAGLKKLVRSRLPKGDPLREAVESQPDTLPEEEFIVMAKAWDRLAATR